MSIKIILVDDHSLVKKGIASTLASYEDIAIVGEAADGQAAIVLIQEQKPDVLITDITMPGMGGLELCGYLREHHPETKVLVLSMHDDEEYIMSALDAGAMGYLSKDASSEEIHDAIQTLHEGNKYLTDRVYKLLANQFITQKAKPEEEQLTLREKEILTQIVEGLSNKQIADKLFISARTVDTHRTNIMKKINANNTAELVRIAITKKLI